MTYLTPEMTKELKADEVKASEAACELLGYKVLVYNVGEWVCAPLDKGMKTGYGASKVHAITNCKEKNQ